jgi:glycosyltransferase involved in cell wall biosynthesis
LNAHYSHQSDSFPKATIPIARRGKMQLRIGIDISRTIGERTGVGTYADSLVRGLSKIDTENEYILYPYFWECFPPNFRQAHIPRQANFHLWIEDLPLKKIQRRWLTTDPDNAMGNVDVVHSTAFTSPPQTKSIHVVTIHDITFLTHPEYHSSANKEFCLKHTQCAVEKAAKIIVPSFSVKRDLLEHYPITEERVAVTYEAAAENYYPTMDQTEIQRVLAKYGVGTNYILFVGTIEPRKNLVTLIRAAENILKKGYPRYSLVIAGPSGWLNSEVYELIRSLGLQNYVLLLGHVDPEELRSLYSAATVFVYPSFYEGFGLPVLEAMACGTPVITSNTSSLPEVAGDAAIQIPPMECAQLEQAIAALISDQALRLRMRQQSLEQAARFSWQDTASRTLEIYRMVAGKGEIHALRCGRCSDTERGRRI